MIVEAIPLDLRQRPQWVIWREEKRNGKRTKVPYQPSSPDRGAKAGDPTTWGTFDLALQAAGDANGVGFEFHEDDPYVGIDIDDCRDPQTGQLTDAARYWIERFATYTEISPTGTGIHMIGRGKVPGSRNRTGPFELYDKERYFTVTGDLIGSSVISDVQDALDELYAALWPEVNETPRQNGANITQPLDDRSLLDRMFSAKNGDVIHDLYDGKWDARYSSQSEADMAFCMHLAFWTGRDEAQMDRLFRSSGLMRDKWDDKRPEHGSYGADTIANACAKTTTVYEPRHLEVVPATRTSSPVLTVVDANDPPPLDSWEPIDLADLPDKPPVEPTLGEVGLVYPGKRHVFSGPQESAKTLAAYAIGIEVIRRGGTIILIDFEMGQYEARNRLRDLGVTKFELRQIHYIEPSEPATKERIEALVALNPSLVIIDAAAGAYDLQGLDDNKRSDVERFTRLYVSQFWRAGIASIVLDHVVKNAEGRGRYAIGSERKVGGTDVHLGFEVIEAIKRGGHGLYKIITHKDRGGFLKRGRLADMELQSDPESHALTWEFKTPESTAEGQPFRPTHLMERVSVHLELAPAPKGRNEIVRDVKGNDKALRQAISVLLSEGYLEDVEDPEDHQKRAVRSVEKYRESDDRIHRIQPHPDRIQDVVADTASTASPPYRGSGEREAVEEMQQSLTASTADDIPF